MAGCLRRRRRPDQEETTTLTCGNQHEAVRIWIARLFPSAHQQQRRRLLMRPLKREDELAVGTFSIVSRYYALLRGHSFDGLGYSQASSLAKGNKETRRRCKLVCHADLARRVRDANLYSGLWEGVKPLYAIDLEALPQNLWVKTRL